MTISIDNGSLRPPAALLMTQGGDGRIRLDPNTGLNRYHSAPRPSAVLAYSSSTANDISEAAFAHVETLLSEFGPATSAADYSDRLESLRRRIRRAYGVDDEVDLVFAPSGTDLEYVPLACVADRGSGTHNILLGADEVGSGCIHSANGAYFAESTALGHPSTIGDPVAGLGGVAVGLVDIPVRDSGGRVRPSAEIGDRIRDSAGQAIAAGRHLVVHVVHGSKTGLILPVEAELDQLQARFGTKATLVVDACQARITGQALSSYLRRGAIVFVTGSKFMGAPPFSGFAFVPRTVASAAPPLPEGLRTIFRRAEWPRHWPGAEILPVGANPGLLLRLEAALFELERFQALPPSKVEPVILAFHSAIRSEILDKMEARRLAPYPPGDRSEADSYPIEMRTLSTLDLSRMNGGATFEQAQHWHKALLARQVRLGQPVKCVRIGGGKEAGPGWGATLRIGLAMWQIADKAGYSADALTAAFRSDMARIREALVAVAA